MSTIISVDGSHAGPAASAPVHRAEARQVEPQPQRQHVDQVDLSDEAKRFSESGMREGLVARVRAEIAAGGYETEGKIDASVQRIVERYDGRF